MMNAPSLKEKTFHGIIWSSAERFSVQSVTFLLQLIMARILSPEEYGIIGMLAIFIAVSQVFIDSGFSSALIQKHDRNETDYATVFYFNIAIGIILYFLLFLISPLVAKFYNTPILTNLTRVVALTILFNSLTVVQRAKLTISLDFKTQTKASLLSVVLSGIIGIWMAYSGYGVWAIAFQSASNTGFNMILLWWLLKWRPRNKFSQKSFRRLFSFGSKLLLSGILNTIYTNLFTLIIGKKFSKTELGNYTRADQFCQFPSSNLTGILQRVTFPILSELQNNNDDLRNVYRRFLRLAAFVIFPLMIGLAALSKPFILLALTEKWSGIIPLMQILCFSYLWYPIHAINLSLLQVKGRSDLFLRLEIIKKIIGISILLITIQIGVTAMCIGSAIGGIIGLIINTYYTGKLIQIGFIKQMQDVIPILFNSLIMGSIVYGIGYIINNHWGQLIIGISVGIIYYLCSNYIIRSKDLLYIFSLIKLK